MITIEGGEKISLARHFNNLRSRCTEENLHLCFSHSIGGDGSEWACPGCYKEYCRRRDLLAHLGEVAAKSNREAAAMSLRNDAPLRIIETPIPGPTVKLCKKLLRSFALRNSLTCNHYCAPFAAGEYGSWSNIVRAYEDQNF